MEEIHSMQRNILSTNGKMLDTMMESTSSCRELSKGQTRHCFISFIEELACNDGEHFDDLIDSGTLIAGHSNYTVAKLILNTFPKVIRDSEG